MLFKIFEKKIDRKISIQFKFNLNSRIHLFNTGEKNIADKVAFCLQRHSLSLDKSVKILNQSMNQDKNVCTTVMGHNETRLLFQPRS